MTTDTIDQLRTLRAQLTSLLVQKADLSQAEKDVKAKIAALIGDARGQLDLGDGNALGITYRKAFDPDRATELLGTSEVYAAICEMKPSAALAKKVLAPAVYEMCQSESTTPTIAPAVPK